MERIKEIAIENIDLFKKYFIRHSPSISEHTFTNLFVWRKVNFVNFIEAENSLIVFLLNNNNVSIWGPPIGALSLEKAVSILEKQFGLHVTAFERIPMRSFNQDGWQISSDRDNFDYVYKRQDLGDLEGRKFHSKRNFVTQCLAEYDCSYEEISDKNLGEVLGMMDKWCAERDCGVTPGLCHEYIAIKELFANYETLGVFGAAIRIEGKVAAFTIGEALNQNTAVIHFEKAMPEYKGLYQLINHWFAKNHLSKFEYVNREQDMGLEGLRKAKESYFPDHFIEKYKVIRQSENVDQFHVKMKRCP